MDPRAGRHPDLGLNDVHERGDVVFGRPLTLVDGGDERLVDRGGVAATRLRVAGGEDAELRVTLGGEQLDLEPPAEPGDVRPDGRHLRE